MSHLEEKEAKLLNDRTKAYTMGDRTNDNPLCYESGGDDLDSPTGLVEIVEKASSARQGELLEKCC